MVWRSGNGVGHINKVKLYRARLVLGLVITVGGSTTPVFFKPLRPTQPGHPSVGRAMSTGDGSQLWGRNSEFYVVVGPVVVAE